MCGFISYITREDQSNNTIIYNKFKHYLKEMNNRGPDFSEKKKINTLDTNIMLGFNRLAIQDLTEKANTIFYDENYIILFNGEIYNYKILKDKYFKNYKFKSNTDTELLFELFKKYNEKTLDLIEGIFSIAFFNLTEQTSLLARDFTGTKPLYYLKNNDGFFFSSEAWFLYSLSKKEFDQSALKFYLTFGFNKNDTTLIKEVKKVKPGTFVLYNWSKKEMYEKDYFLLNEKKINTNSVCNIDTFFSDIIKKNLISDTKVGTLLSGGIDSTLVTLYARNFTEKLESFTTCFLPEEKYKKFNIDLEFSKELAKRFDIKLNISNIDNETDILNDFEKVTDYFDEPTSNLNFLNIYWLTKNASDKDFKVVLTGDGGDEMFLGYDRYKKIEISKYLSPLKFLNKNLKSYCNKNPEELSKYIHGVFKINNPFKILSDELNDVKHAKMDLFKNINFKNNLDLINYFDTKFWLTSENNYKLDKCSMLNSIEARVPLQDIEIIKNFFFLKNTKKFSFFKNKKILDKLSILPEFIKKRKKMGYFNPERIFLDNNLEKIVNNLVFNTNNSNMNIFNENKIKNVFKSYNNFGYKIKREITTLVLLQIWSQKINKLL